MTSKSLTQSPWLPVLAGGAVIGVALGIRHVQGLFLVPVTMGHGWTRETFGLAIALQNLIWGAAQPFAGMLAAVTARPRWSLPASWSMRLG